MGNEKARVWQCLTGLTVVLMPWIVLEALTILTRLPVTAGYARVISVA